MILPIQPSGESRVVSSWLPTKAFAYENRIEASPQPEAFQLANSTHATCFGGSGYLFTESPSTFPNVPVWSVDTADGEKAGSESSTVPPPVLPAGDDPHCQCSLGIDTEAKHHDKNVLSVLSIQRTITYRLCGH